MPKLLRYESALRRCGQRLEFHHGLLKNEEATRPVRLFTRIKDNKSFRDKDEQNSSHAVSPEGVDFTR
jgi:hypothetical protein